jgi:uncharacterized membrane protein
MLNIILKIIMWILIVFLVVLVAFWVYGMITSKEFRDANIEGWKASVREHERKKRAKKPYWTDRQYKRYLRTGNRHHLVYDYDDEDDE